MLAILRSGLFAAFTYQARPTRIFAAPVMSAAASAAPAVSELATAVAATSTGQQLLAEEAERARGAGSAHTDAKLRLFGRTEADVRVTLYRDTAAWCPYCQKVHKPQLARGETLSASPPLPGLVTYSSTGCSRRRTRSTRRLALFFHVPFLFAGLAPARGEAGALQSRQDQHALVRRQAARVPAQGAQRSSTRAGAGRPVHDRLDPNHGACLC